MIIKFLGTASNGGLPQQDCTCINCFDARLGHENFRLRSSLAFSENGAKWSIVDCGPDFRQQLLRINLLIPDIELITLTHLHPDHCSGLFELGVGKSWGTTICVDPVIERDICRQPIFNSLFDQGFVKLGKSPLVRFVTVNHWPGHPCVAVVLGNNKVFFVSDCAEIDSRLQMEMRKCDLVVFDGTFLNESKHNHLSIKESCQKLSEIGKRVMFTHFNHTEDMGEVRHHISKFNFEIAEDDMTLEL